MKAAVLGLLLASLSLSCTANAVGEVQAVSQACHPWKLIRSPTFSGATLFGVGGSSSTDVWALGWGNTGPAVLEHWDGARWTPWSQPLGNGALLDVAAIAPDDAWAVGNDNSNAIAVIERWDGAAWTLVPLPLPDGASLPAVAALASDDVWAAGQYSAPNGSIQPLFLHWNGTTWKPVRQGHGTEQSGGIMFDLLALSPTDIWSVGYKGTQGFADYVPLAEHWDGTSWQVVDAPSPPGAGANILRAVSGAATDDVWAVGSTNDGGFIEHWDGTSWTLESETDGSLWAVGASATDDVWAGGGAYLAPTLILHWDGVAWTQVPSPQAGTQSSLRAISVITPTDVWAVGNYSPEGFSQLDPLIEHYSGPC